MTQLIVLVCLYMLVSVGIGLWAARRVRNTADYALAGRSLPLMMVITATFATWFGSETVLGLPGRFIEGGIAGVIEEPFGSGMALVFLTAAVTAMPVIFLLRRLYRTGQPLAIPFLPFLACGCCTATLAQLFLR